MTDPFRRSPEIEAVARRWLNNYALRRTEAVLDVFSRSAALSYIGSDAGEIFAGEAMRRVFPAFTEAHARLVPESFEIEGWEAGDFGYARASFVTVQPEAGARASVRSTIVLSLEGGIWRVVHVHNSTPSPNIEAHGYESHGLEELAAAAEREALQIAGTGIASIMFTDIADSTALAAALGDAAWSRIARDHLALVARCIEAAGGTLAKSLGDGTLSSFASARAALGAACAIQRANAALEAEPRLRLRIGLHTGDLVRTEDDVLGGVVNKAARIAAAAAPGEIRLSEATRLMAGEAQGLAFDDPVRVALKGFEGEHALHRLVWRGPEAAQEAAACDA